MYLYNPFTHGGSTENILPLKSILKTLSLANKTFVHTHSVRAVLVVLG